MNNRHKTANDYQPENLLMAQRLEKLESFRAAGIDPYCNSFRVEQTILEVFRTFGGLTQSQLDAAAPSVAVAGRIRFCRRMGKATFVKIQDWTVRDGIKPPGLTVEGESVQPTDDFLQLLVRVDVVGEEIYGLTKKLDLGDYVGVRGVLMRTRTGELTVQVQSLSLLGKSIRPLPEKWHGLSDIETRFRQRYIDLLMNSRAREILHVRFEVVRLLRRFFHRREYVEVETPMLHNTPGGAAARPFKTHHNALDLDLFLRIAPELYLKRMLVGGFGRVFEIGRVFRNEGLSRVHSPEYTILEFYQAFATFHDLMELTEELITSLVRDIHGRLRLTFGDLDIDFTPPWPRLTVAQAVARYGGLEEASLRERRVLEQMAQQHEIPDVQTMADGKLLMALFDEIAQPHLIQPTFITHYPVAVSPLSRRNEDDPSLVDRFELFIAGSEIANAFNELTDPVDQYERFLQQLAAKEAGDEEAHPMDQDFVRALEYGMPPAAGEGIGVDRLVMILADASSIREVIPFPLLRPEDGTASQAE